jgi:citronellol/citronellal dehydrogenase
LSDRLASLKGRAAIVTGGGTGIGRAIAEALADHGVDLVLVGRRAEVVEAVARKIAADRGIRATFVAGDVRDEAALEEAVAHAYRELGRLDILVNNAGGQFVAPAEMISRRGWQAVIDIDLNATFYWSQRVARGWIDAEETGTIINIVGPFRDRGTPGMAHSGAARAAVVQLVRSLAAEWAPFGIRVNNIGPAVLTDGLRAEFASSEGSVVDEMTRRLPTGRWGTLEEVGDVAVFLASEMAAYVSGETIVMDGAVWSGEGFGMRPISKRRWPHDPDAEGRRDWPRHLFEAGDA